MANLRLASGDPFDAEFAPPAYLRRAYRVLTWEFRSGGVFNAAESPDPWIAEEFASEALTRALQSIDSVLRPFLDGAEDSDEPLDHRWVDGLHLDLSARYTECIQAIEDDDGVPTTTLLGGGKYLSARQHLGALGILQVDRASTALRIEDAGALAAILWDLNECTTHMCALDEYAIFAGSVAGPDAAARERGRAVGQRRHAKTNELKKWALDRALEERGSEMQIARQLVDEITTNLVNVSSDPERLIYEALRARRRGPARDLR